MYNAVTREVERELLPCLRALGMRFYAYNPLAGGLLTGKYTRASLESVTEGRFRLGNELYRGRYLHPAQLEASEAFAKAAADAGITPSRAALRWLRHHSALRAREGDGVIVGASRPAHIDDNLAGLDEGPLPPAVLAAADKGWEGIRCAGCVPSYERGHSKYD
jgi:aflatoxin B1 aldehyde reductase